MAKAFFSRYVPFYVMAPEEVTDSNGFDAYPVEVSEATLSFARNMREVVDSMEAAFMESPAPEEAAQTEADLLNDLLEGS
jgi:hypothetical protein